MEEADPVVLVPLLDALLPAPEVGVGVADATLSGNLVNVAVVDKVMC